MVEQFAFHDHSEGAPCSVECWTLDNAPWDRKPRQDRLEHNHVFQVQPEDLPYRHCPACATINMKHMRAHPYKLASGEYDINVRHGGWG